ncbi:MAG TPA: CBS domain-containing protein [Edaphocola sp.]|nr:CBS domain-containing protein [Edaphocola sp.]
MSLVELIEPTIPVLKLNDTVEDALRIMSETHFDKLPLVDNGEYLSIVKETDLMDSDFPNTLLCDFAHGMSFRPCCNLTAHPFDAVVTAVRFKLAVVPVLDEKMEYVGSISRETLFYFLGENESMQEQGGIIILEMKMGDFVLSQIAKIAENEDVIILNSRVSHNIENGTIEVTLKTNKVELDRLVAAYERYEYTVKEAYGNIPSQNDTENRYKLLMNYLNM